MEQGGKYVTAVMYFPPWLHSAAAGSPGGCSAPWPIGFEGRSSQSRIGYCLEKTDLTIRFLYAMLSETGGDEK